MSILQAVVKKVFDFFQVVRTVKNLLDLRRAKSQNNESLTNLDKLFQRDQDGLAIDIYSEKKMFVKFSKALESVLDSLLSPELREKHALYKEKSLQWEKETIDELINIKNRLKQMTKIENKAKKKAEQAGRGWLFL